MSDDTMGDLADALSVMVMERIAEVLAEKVSKQVMGLLSERMSEEALEIFMDKVADKVVDKIRARPFGQPMAKDNKLRRAAAAKYGSLIAMAKALRMDYSRLAHDVRGDCHVSDRKKAIIAVALGGVASDFWDSKGDLLP